MSVIFRELQDVRFRHRDGVDVPHQSRDRERADIRGGRGDRRWTGRRRVFVFPPFVGKEGFLGVLRVRRPDLLVNF